MSRETKKQARERWHKRMQDPAYRKAQSKRKRQAYWADPDKARQRIRRLYRSAKWRKYYLKKSKEQYERNKDKVCD